MHRQLHHHYHPQQQLQHCHPCLTNTTAAIVIIILFMTFFSAALALSSALFSCSFIMLRDLPKSSWLASLLVAADQNLMPVMCLWWFPTIPSRDYGFCQYGSGFKHVILSVFIWGIVFLRGILKKKIDIDTFVASYSKLRSYLIARELIMANGILDQRQDKDKTLPKAQRTRGLSSYQRISIKHQLQNLNQTSASWLNLKIKSWPNLASESRPRFNFILLQNISSKILTKLQNIERHPPAHSTPAPQSSDGQPHPQGHL